MTAAAGGEAVGARYRPDVPELNLILTARLIEVLDCTVTLRRGVDDRLTEAGIVVTTGWQADDPGDIDRSRLTRRVVGEPDAEGWLSAQVVALHGYLLDLAEPDVLDRADEISGPLLTLAARLHRDGDTVLALDNVDWFSPFDSISLAQASLVLIERAVAGLCDRLAYGLGEHLQLVDAGHSEPPDLEHPANWWVARGWADLGDGLVVRTCGR